MEVGLHDPSTVSHAPIPTARFCTVITLAINNLSISDEGT